MPHLINRNNNNSFQSYFKDTVKKLYENNVIGKVVYRYWLISQ